LTREVELPERSEARLTDGDRVVVTTPEKTGLRIEHRDSRSLQRLGDATQYGSKPGRLLGVNISHKRIVLDDDGGISEWDLEPARERWGCAAETRAELAFSTEAGMPYLMKTRDLVSLVDPDSQQIVQEVYRRDDGHHIHSVGTNRWGNFAFVKASTMVDGERGRIEFGPAEIFIWDLRSRRFVGSIRESAEDEYVLGLDISPDGTKALGKTATGTVVWDVGTGRKQSTLSRTSAMPSLPPMERR
jgi:hypothetical protein